MSHKGWMDFFSHWSQISLGCSLQSLVWLYFLAFFGRVFISNSQIFLGSKWQFCFSTGKGKMLENFSQYRWTSVLHTSTWIFLGCFLPLAIELDGVRTSDVVDGLLFHVTVGRL